MMPEVAQAMNKLGSLPIHDHPGSGRTLFDGAPGRPRLRRLNSRAFKNGHVFLHYSV